ncbi:hypothetical protein DFQ27_006619, partial [Actinomortierella ambigua]
NDIFLEAFADDNVCDGYSGDETDGEESVGSEVSWEEEKVELQELHGEDIARVDLLAEDEKTGCEAVMAKGGQRDEAEADATGEAAQELGIISTSDFGAENIKRIFNHQLLKGKLTAVAEGGRTLQQDDASHEEDRFVLHFALKHAHLPNWMSRYGDLLGVGYICHRKRHYQGLSKDIFSVEYKCHCHGKLEKSKNAVPGGKSKKPRKSKVSKRCGCRSRVYAQYLYRKSEGDKPPDYFVDGYYIVSLRYAHGHPLDEIESTGKTGLSEHMRGLFEAKLNDGLADRSGIRQLVIDYGAFTKCLSSNNNGLLSARRDDIVTTRDVNNIRYTMHCHQIRKHKSDHESAMLWMQDFEQRGYFTHFRKHEYYGWSSPWQLNVLAQWSNTWRFHGTHRVRAELSDILYCQDQATAMELVSAFRIKWEPKAPLLIQHLDHQYFDPLPPPKDKNSALDPYKKMKEWMFCFRPGVSFSRIHANSDVEPWNTLSKTRFFMGYHERRVDHVMFILDQQATSRFQLKSHRYKSSADSSPGRQVLDCAVKQAMAHFNKMREADDAYVPFEQHPDFADQLKVFSFTSSSQRYTVSVEWDGPNVKYVRSCSCERQRQTNECCKHIGMLLYLFDGSSFVGNPRHGVSSERLDEQSVEQPDVASEGPLDLETDEDITELKKAIAFHCDRLLEKKNYDDLSPEFVRGLKRIIL